MTNEQAKTKKENRTSRASRASNASNGSNEVLAIPERVTVFDDPRSHAKTVALTFQFPDGTNGILMVSRLSRIPWSPEKVIKEITITWI